MDTNEFDLLDTQANDDQEPVKAVEPAKEPLQQSDQNFLSLAANNAGVDLNNSQVQILQDFMNRAARGHQSVLPMKCKGTGCPFLNICPLYQAKAALPTGKLCPVEQAVMAQWVQITMQALDIDPNDDKNAVDVNMVYELAGMEMLRYRAAWHLSIEPELVTERIVGYSPQGEPIMAEQPKMALLILERYAKVIGKLREQLLATRRSQAQVGRIAGDVSVRGAQMFAKARAIAEQRMNGKKIADAEFTVKDGLSSEGSSEKKQIN